MKNIAYLLKSSKILYSFYYYLVSGIYLHFHPKRGLVCGTHGGYGSWTSDDMLEDAWKCGLYNISMIEKYDFKNCRELMKEIYKEKQ